MISSTLSLKSYNQSRRASYSVDEYIFFGRAGGFMMEPLEAAGWGHESGPGFHGAT